MAECGQKRGYLIMLQVFCYLFSHSDSVYTCFQPYFVLGPNISFINNLSPLSSFLKVFCVLTALTLWVMGLKIYLLGEMMEWYKCIVLTIQMSLFYDLIRSVHLKRLYMLIFIK